MTDPEQVPVATYPRLYVPADDDAADAVAYAECVTFPTGAALYDAPPTTDDAVATDPPFKPTYLVVLNGTFEDLPVGLFERGGEALQFAREVRSDPHAHAARFYAAIEAGADYLTRCWLSVAVIEFSGPVPVCRTDLFGLD